MRSGIRRNHRGRWCEKGVKDVVEIPEKEASSSQRATGKADRKTRSHVRTLNGDFCPRPLAPQTERAEAHL